MPENINPAPCALFPDLKTPNPRYNVAHVLFSVTNYVYAYVKLRPKCDGPIKVALDPGDYTQAAAAYYARLCGVPIHTVITAEDVDAGATGEGGGEGEGAGSVRVSDDVLPGLERLAFEFCGRDPGRIVEAAAAREEGGAGIQRLVKDMCPPDFRMVPVGHEAQAKAAASTSHPLCAEACRALAAAVASGGTEGAGAVGDMPVLIVAPKLPGGSVDEGTGPAGTISGSAAAPGNRNVLVSSAISIRDFICETLPPYPPLSLPGPQVVAALNHLKRLSSRARDRLQRRKVLELSELLMAALHENAASLSVKDTCLALNSVADAVKSRVALDASASNKGAAKETGPRLLLQALRRRLEDHLSQAPFRFSGRLMGLAMNALAKLREAKVREVGDMEEQEEMRLYDLAERLILLKAEESGAFDLITVSQFAHAYTAMLTCPAPPPGVDPHLVLPELEPDYDDMYGSGYGGGPMRGDFGLQRAYSAESGIDSASDGLALLEELEMWATEKNLEEGGEESQGAGANEGGDDSSTQDEMDGEDDGGGLLGVAGGRQGSGRNSVPLSTYGPKGYGLEETREGGARLGSLTGSGVEDDGEWRQYGRYGRAVEFVASQALQLDATGLQPQGLAHLVHFLGKSGMLRQDKEVYAHMRALVLGMPSALFSEVPFALSLLIDGLQHSGAPDEELHRHLAFAADGMSTRFITDKILLDLLEGFEALDAMHAENRVIMAAASAAARPLDKVRPHREEQDWRICIHI